nr:PEPxxWA-CTERM sorting domain-containing protein [Parasphingorhabdus marina]
MLEIVSPAVPEPATWAMMIGGFGLVGGAMRRRKKLTAQPALA